MSRETTAMIEERAELAEAFARRYFNEGLTDENEAPLKAAAYDVIANGRPHPVGLPPPRFSLDEDQQAHEIIAALSVETR